MPSNHDELRAALAALALLRGLQGWLVAAGMGAALPPLVFAFAGALRIVWPGLPPLGPGFFQVLVAIAGLTVLVLVWRRPETLRVGSEEALALLAFGLILGVRFWLAEAFPVPPLTDSLHHAMLTEEVARSGLLPQTMPVFPAIDLDRYHLGLYAITGATAWLGDVEGYVALVWMGQLLNALAALGVYLVLDRHVSREAALVGVLACGLISHMPSAYLGWGRFTQVGGQAILPIAWVVTWEWLRCLHRRSVSKPAAPAASLGLLAVLLSAAVALVHLRVALFLLPLLLLTLGRETSIALRTGRAAKLLFSTLSGVGAALLLLLPRYGRGAWHWFWGHWFLASDGNSWSGTDDLRGLNAEEYFSSWESVPLTEWIGAPLLVGVAVIFGAIAVARGERLSRLVLAWTIMLLLLGSVPYLGIHVINIVPLNSVLIFLYFPLALWLGCGVHALGEMLPVGRRNPWQKGAVGAAFVIGLLSLPARIQEIPPPHNLVEPADLTAFAWIRENVRPRARFAIAGHALFPDFIVGTDGGYWIPYFTGHQTIPGPMLAPLAPRFLIRAGQQFALQREPGFADRKVNRLLARGISHYYFSRSARKIVDARKLAHQPRLDLVYDREGVQILHLTHTPEQLELAGRVFAEAPRRKKQKNLGDYPLSWPVPAEATDLSEPAAAPTRGTLY
jgi:hypothetical protein